MTTPQNSALAAVKARLAAIEELRWVGAFPDDVERLGANLPAALIGDGDQTEYRSLPGRRLQYDWRLEAWLYLDTTRDRQQTANSLADAVIDAVLAPGLPVASVEVLSVEKGEAAAASPDFHAPGVYHHLTVQRVTFSMLLTDIRS